MADITQLTGDYAASWLPWLMIPLIFYILPFPIIALVFLWIENEGLNPELDPAVGNGGGGGGNPGNLPQASANPQSGGSTHTPDAIMPEI
jgi:photosystem I subunit VIII